MNLIQHSALGYLWEKQIKWLLVSVQDHDEILYDEKNKQRRVMHLRVINKGYQRRVKELSTNGDGWKIIVGYYGDGIQSA